MKILKFILFSLVNVLFTSADPNLFGSRKRRKAKEKLAKEFKGIAADTQAEIDELKTQNPFETAAAKSAMTQSGRKAKQIQKRYMNMLGGQTNPEALVASQGATQEAVASTAGNIAVGAEANKAAQLAQLRGEKAAQMGQYAGVQESAIAERGSGWTGFFSALDSVGSLAQGAGAVMGAI